jgi:tripartite-type tricarboxylate transporter receptor subunit TctC
LKRNRPIFGPINTALPYIWEGKVLALVVSDPQRASVLPDVPTTLEAGFPNSDYTVWVGMFAPAKTPRSIIDQLHQETFKALQAPSTREKLAKVGIEPRVMTRAEFDVRVQNDIAISRALVKAAGIKANKQGPDSIASPTEDQQASSISACRHLGQYGRL